MAVPALPRSTFRKASIVIPVYNEERYLLAVLDAVRGVALPAGVDREIIVVDDGSTDRTAGVLASYAHAHELSVHRLPRNLGKGAAVREGLRHVTGDVVILQDADLEYSVDDYASLLEPVISGRARVVYGSRFRGVIRGMRLPNRVFNHLIRWLVNVLFDARITDEATAYKVLETDLLRSLDLTATRFEICPEITAKVLQRGIRIHEVPVTYHGRTVSEGKKVGWRDAIEAVRTLLKFRFEPQRDAGPGRCRPGGPKADTIERSPRRAACLPKEGRAWF